VVGDEATGEGVGDEAVAAVVPTGVMLVLHN
jgi:hypothetical protein